jgi:hypothetical protein
MRYDITEVSIEDFLAEPWEYWERLNHCMYIRHKGIAKTFDSHIYLGGEYTHIVLFFNHILLEKEGVTWWLTKQWGPTPRESQTGIRHSVVYSKKQFLHLLRLLQRRGR